MSNTASTLAAITQALALVDTLIALSGNEKRFRAMVSRAVAEGRPLSEEELDGLRDEAESAVTRLGDLL